MNPNELSVLSKGLSFVPTKKADSFNTKVELFKFYRTIKLKAFFNKTNNLVNPPLSPQLGRTGENIRDSNERKVFKPKSTFVPTVFNASVNTFCRLVDQEVFSLFSPLDSQNHCYPNFTSQEMIALKELSGDQSLVIRRADKGGAIVLQNRESYIDEINRQLSNTEFYKMLSGDPTIVFSKEIKCLLDKALLDQIISKEEYKFMLKEHPVRPILYTLPKIHKSIVPPVPGRPIVAGIGSLTEPLSQYIDFHIKDVVTKLPSFLKDTSDFLNKLESMGNISDSEYICTMDVTSLYTNVPHEEGLEALKHYMELRETQSPSTDFIIDLTRVVLTKNYFKFENNFYLQIQGVSMGSPFSPNYANLFMGKFEEDHVYSNNPYKSYIRGWCRFIDDVFFLFSGPVELLNEFLLYINSRLPSIKFTLEASQESVSFLDVLVKKNQGVQTTVYRKKTDRNNYLHFSSYHPSSLKKGLPYSQLLRLKRICNTESEYEGQSAEMCDRFRARGYNEHILSISKSKVKPLERTSLLAPKSPGILKKQPIIMSTTFSPISQSIKQIIMKHWHILSSDPEIGNAFPIPPIFAKKRANNLSDKLIKNDISIKPLHFLSTLPPGNFPCKGCINCNAMITGDTIIHPHTGKKIKVKGRITCKTKYVVYLLKCPCGFCYVGKTKRELKTRIIEHKSNIRNKDEKSPVARHFNNIKHDICTLRFQGIEVVNPMKRGGDRDRLLLQREAFWIHNLNTEFPKGLNEELLLNCFL